MKTITAILAVICVLLVATLIVLLGQNARLKSQIQKQNDAIPGQYLQRLGEFRITAAVKNPDDSPARAQDSFMNCVEGVVTNVSGKKLEVAIIGFTLRDNAGNQVDYIETSTRNLSPHGTWKFKTRQFDSRLNPICTKFEGVIDSDN